MTELFPYQRAGAAFLAENRRAMLLDEPGLGKTAQAIEACNIVGADPVLVVCPASAAPVWQREWKRFGRGQSLTIASFDRVSRDWRRYDGPWSAVIIDEAHYLKSPNAKRTRVLYGDRDVPGIVHSAAYVFALTGTPAPNNPSEIYTHMRALQPRSLVMASNPTCGYDRDAFMRRYFILRETEYGPRVVGTRNMDDLRARLAPWTLRRTKAEVLGDLPPLALEPLPLHVPDAAKALADIPGEEVAAVRAAIEGGDAGALSALVARSPALRRITALAKVGAVIDWTRDFLAQTDRKIVIFAYHTEALDLLSKALEVYGTAPPRICGRTTGQHRDLSVKRFQTGTGPADRVFLGQITAAGMAITLTAASDLILLEQSWTPDDNFQAMMRIHRVGQTRGCIARYAILPGSIDEAVQTVLARKTSMRLFD